MSKLYPGLGVRARHSRACPTATGPQCTQCQPTYEAWVWDARRHKKIRRSFRTMAEARKWRLDRLKGYYADGPVKPGKLDKAYSFLRKAADELQGAIPELRKDHAVKAHAAFASIYEAQDAVLTVLTTTVRESHV